MTRPRSNPLRLLSHALAAVFNSRATFNREWKRFPASPDPADPAAGRWTGEWISEQTGHRGQLRCVLIPMAPQRFRACFYASFSWLFRVGYVTELNAERNGDRTRLTGQEDLGALAGGIYRCEGEIIGPDFNCRYTCRYDHGLFRLKRLH